MQSALKCFDPIVREVAFEAMQTVIELTYRKSFHIQSFFVEVDLGICFPTFYELLLAFRVFSFYGF
jgi:hypothetical protein